MTSSSMSCWSTTVELSGRAYGFYDAFLGFYNLFDNFVDNFVNFIGDFFANIAE